MVVKRNIISTRIDNDSLGMQGDHVIIETQQHLVRRLSTDAPAHIAVLLEKLLMTPYPVLRNTVTHKHNTTFVLRQSLYNLVIQLITLEISPILCRLCHNTGKAHRHNQRN